MHLEPKTPPAGRLVQREGGAWQMKLLPGDGKRVEFAWYAPAEQLPVGEAFEWGIEAGIESAVTPAGHEWCLWQWHPPIEPALEKSNPLLFLVIRDGLADIRVFHEHSRPFDPSKKTCLNIAERIPMKPGQLYRWHVEAKIAKDGFVRVRRDGVLLADYVGPIGFHMEGKPYAKAGIYKWAPFEWAGEIKALVRY